MGTEIARETVRNEACAGLAGKYITFKLAGEEYALEILKVREIIGLMDITPMPCTSAAMRGVINLRGAVIPVLDLRSKFHMPPAEVTDQTVIIVVQYAARGRKLTIGILVDEVVEVLNIEGQNIEPAPNLEDVGEGSSFLMGVGKADRRLVFLLDIGKVLVGESERDLLLGGLSTSLGLEA